MSGMSMRGGEQGASTGRDGHDQIGDVGVPYGTSGAGGMEVGTRCGADAAWEGERDVLEEDGVWWVVGMRERGEAGEAGHKESMKWEGYSMR